MKTLNIMAVKAFLPVFMFSISFFVLILQLVDIFANLWRYLSNDVSILQILSVAFLYLPKCISFALPPSLLFSISFTLGNYYSNNELISVFGSGISLFRFVTPFIFIGILISLGGFIFQERVVIDTFEKKNIATKTLLRQQISYSNTNITVLSGNADIIYKVDYYNDNNHSMSGIIVLLLDSKGNFFQRIDAEKGYFDDGKWIFSNCRIFKWDDKNEFLTEIKQNQFTMEGLNESPDTFRKTIHNIDEMKIEDARQWIASLKKAGLPFRGVLTEYYKRYSFALTPIVVAFISSALGGKFKKNILLMSLLMSLVLTVVYYVIQMLLVLFAKLGYIPPSAGAWGTFIIFLIPGSALFKIART